MGVFDKLFGGKKKDSPKPAPRRPSAPRRDASPAPRREPPPESAGTDAVSELQSKINALDGMTAKQLTRQLGGSNAELRAAAAQRLGELKDRAALRPLANVYLMHGDPEALEALRGYGTTLTNPLHEYSMDLSIVGDRRGRLMDMLGATGDDQVLPMVRQNIDDKNPTVRTRACAALVKLGDLHGISRLDQDLQTTDVEARVMALETLIELDIPEAERCVADHIKRFTAEAGAVPQTVDVTAPRLDDPQLKLIDYVLEHVRTRPHDLSLVIGSEAIGWATSQRDAIEKALPGMEVHFATRRMIPEEQFSTLTEARDAAAAGRKAVFVGMIPSPRDEPPLQHFLTKVDDGYRAGIFIIDPHEYFMAQSWWQYVQDDAEVDTDVEIVLGISRPSQSAISEEEYDMYRMLKDDEQRKLFVRALMARL